MLLFINSSIVIIFIIVTQSFAIYPHPNLEVLSTINSFFAVHLKPLQTWVIKKVIRCCTGHSSRPICRNGLPRPMIYCSIDNRCNTQSKSYAWEFKTWYIMHTEISYLQVHVYWPPTGLYPYFFSTLAMNDPAYLTIY